MGERVFWHTAIIRQKVSETVPSFFLECSYSGMKWEACLLSVYAYIYALYHLCRLACHRPSPSPLRGANANAIQISVSAMRTTNSDSSPSQLMGFMTQNEVCFQ